MKNTLSSNFLMVNRMIKNLSLQQLNYDKGTPTRDEFANAIQALSTLKKIIGEQIDKEKK